MSVEVKDVLSMGDISAVRPLLGNSWAEVRRYGQRECNDVSPLGSDVPGHDESALPVGKTDRLPAVGVIDVIGIVDRLIARVVRVGARMQVAELVGAVVVAKLRD